VCGLFEILEKNRDLGVVGVWCGCVCVCVWVVCVGGVCVCGGGVGWRVVVWVWCGVVI